MKCKLNADFLMAFEYHMRTFKNLTRFWGKCTHAYLLRNVYLLRNAYLKDPSVYCVHSLGIVKARSNINTG